MTNERVQRLARRIDRAVRAAGVHRLCDLRGWTMKSIDKLRDAWQGIGGETSCAGCYYKIEDYINEIEAEIAERYMLLPVDADGVPIHVGDICEMNGDQFEVRQLRTDGDYWWAIDRLGEFCMAKDCRHVKPRTLEDVLRDVWNEALDYAKSNIWRNPDEVFAERADEIRELLGGDAE